jgi:methyltransferase
LILAVGVERLVELAVSKRHAAWAFSLGGEEFGRGHFPAMVALHTALLVGAMAEMWMLDRPFLPILGWAALVVVIASQSLRWWCIATLGRQWNTRVIVVPGLPLVSRGPYRLLRHPNYLAVVLEGAALPLVHSAWATAAGFTVLNAVLLARRIQVEERALATVAGEGAAMR